jgi:DNA/RNA endonuclease YhcR with UshA esterase domain
VKGQVTAPPGIFGARTMYIQDETAGIMIYLPRDHRLMLKLGDKIRLEGNLRFFQEEAEIAVSKRQRIDFIEPGIPPHPLPIETTMMLEPFEGMLVMLQGQAVRFQGRTTFWVDDGTDPAKVYVRQSTGIKKSFINPGTPVTVLGIVSQYSEENPTRGDYRLLPRFQSDLGFPEVVPPPKPEKPTLLPETGHQ